jgi:dTDP-4-amino-4,6-dideoxygalactose transaminase
MSTPQHTPILDLAAQLSAYRDAALAAITRVVDSQQFILGPEVDAFEAALAASVGTRGAVGLSSGTDALLVALMALDVGPGDEVIVPALSFFATAGAVSRLGATPVFVDVDPRTFNMTEAHARAAITPRTKAIIPVHLFGQTADLGALYDTPREGRPAIIEDAAQAIGSAWRGRPSGSLGEVCCTSFFPSKNLGCFGDGGAVYGDDLDLLEKIRVLRMHGSKPKYHHLLVGGNFRLDALQAAVLSVKLPLLEGWAEARRRNAAWYIERLKARGLIGEDLSGERLTAPLTLPHHTHVFNQFVVRTPQRDALKAHLERAGIGTMIYYPSPLHTQPCFAPLGYGAGDFPEAERACREVLAIPVYPEMTEAQREGVLEALCGFFEGGARA